MNANINKGRECGSAQTAYSSREKQGRTCLNYMIKIALKYERKHYQRMLVRQRRNSLQQHGRTGQTGQTGQNRTEQGIIELNQKNERRTKVKDVCALAHKQLPVVGTTNRT